jgi:hypothetical protein
MGWTTGARFPAGARFSLLHSGQSGSGAYPACIVNIRDGREPEVHFSLPSSSRSSMMELHLPPPRLHGIMFN